MAALEHFYTCRLCSRDTFVLITYTVYIGHCYRARWQLICAVATYRQKSEVNEYQHGVRGTASNCWVASERKARKDMVTDIDPLRRPSVAF
jgi:hypothetical protein